MTDTKINTVIANAKCCLGEITCTITRKAMYGQGFEATKRLGMEVSLYIFALTTYLTWKNDQDCMEALAIEKVVSRINKICSCDCTSSGVSSSTDTGEHTVADHTVTDHTI